MQETDIPIGLINTSWGGTTVETWMNPDAQQYCDEFKDLLNLWKPVLETKSPEILKFYRKMAEWEEDVTLCVVCKKADTSILRYSARIAGEIIGRTAIAFVGA